MYIQKVQISTVSSIKHLFQFASHIFNFVSTLFSILLILSPILVAKSRSCLVLKLYLTLHLVNCFKICFVALHGSLWSNLKNKITTNCQKLCYLGHKAWKKYFFNSNLKFTSARHPLLPPQGNKHICARVSWNIVSYSQRLMTVCVQHFRKNLGISGLAKYFESYQIEIEVSQVYVAVVYLWNDKALLLGFGTCTSQVPPLREFRALNHMWR